MGLRSGCSQLSAGHRPVPYCVRVSEAAGTSDATSLLMAVPNVSEGRDGGAVRAIAEAFTADGSADLLNIHSDSDHHRSVYTLAGAPGRLSGALLDGAREAIARVDVTPSEPSEKSGSPMAAGEDEPRGAHPHVGAVDVVPIVYLDEAARGAACAEALVLADRIGDELGVPVLLYGELAGGRTRAQLRSDGVLGLARRIAAGEPRPDFGPASVHPSAGATLVAARPPLVAFNLQLAPPASVADARRIAALIREGGAEGLPGVRALGIQLGGGIPQVSTNIERPFEIPLALVIEHVLAHAPIASTELVGLAPRAALADFPEDVPLPGFDPARHVIENALGS